MKLNWLEEHFLLNSTLNGELRGYVNHRKFKIWYNLQFLSSQGPKRLANQCEMWFGRADYRFTIPC